MTNLLLNVPTRKTTDDPTGRTTTARTCPHLSKRLQREFIALIKVTERYKKGRPSVLWVWTLLEGEEGRAVRF